MKEHRNALVLYSTAVCNLNCRYCYIDKNPSLIKIDELLDESFKGDYYFDFAKEVFYQDNLTEVQIWGGEPSMRLDRLYYTVDKLINYFPNLTNFLMSTNLTLDTFFDQFYGLLDILGKYPERKFSFSLQLSIDGPPPINDLNRGKGVTELFSKNFVKLITTIEEVLDKYQNITFISFFKPTLDGSSIRQLQTKEKIVNYYTFLEKYKDLTEKTIAHERFSFDSGVPNTACPSPHTVEEGKMFANFIKLCREIEKENIEKKYFKYYNYITPFGGCRDCGGKFDLRNKGICGTGHSVIGLLPNKYISTCHNGFTQLLGDYKNYCIKNKDEVDRTIDFNLFLNGTIENNMVFPYEMLSRYEEQVLNFYDMDQNFLMQNYLGIIEFLALCNQIDRKYLDYNNAVAAAKAIYSRTSICVRDNIGSTGTKFINPVGLFKLLLNGALDYLMQEGDEY